MKSNTTSVDRMIKSFDKELKSILEKDLRDAKTAHKVLIKNIEPLLDVQLKTA